MGRKKGSKDKTPRVRGGLHYFCTFQKAVKYHLLKKLTKIDKFAAYVICDELGFGNHKHSHAYFRTNKRQKIDDFRKELIALKCGLGDIQPCRNVDNSIRYVSKEDMRCVVYNIDKEKLHVNWRINDIIENNEHLNYLDYKVRSIPLCNRKQLVDEHTQYWNEMQLLKEEEEVDEQFVNERVLTEINNSAKKGVWLWGRSGTGKTTTILKAASKPYCAFHAKSDNFPLSGYAGERDIVLADADVLDFYKHRTLILQLTHNFTASYDVKFHSCKKLRLRGKFLVSSNMHPPIEPEFERRFLCIEM